MRGNVRRFDELLSFAANCRRNPSDHRRGGSRVRANYWPMKVPAHPPPPSLIWLLTIWADCVEGNASRATIGTWLVALVFFKVIFVTPPERHTDTFPVSQSTPAFLAE